jgi:CDP-diacylglycerol--glycerol-3-phosphate 3-phosphatidyltransferase
VTPPAGAAPSPWNLPNLLTVLRIALVPVFGWFLLAEGGRNPGYRLAALVVFLAALVTDNIDGDLARRRGQVTNFGKIADPIADKALLGMAFVGLSLLGEVPWWITVLVLAREISVTAVRFVVIRHGVMPAGRGGKLKTVLQAAALSLLVAPLWVLPGEGFWRGAAYVVLGAAVLVTVVTGLDYLVQARMLRRTSARSARRATRDAR